MVTKVCVDTLFISLYFFLSFLIPFQSLIRGRVGQSTVIVNKNGPTVMTILREKFEKDGYLSVEVDAVRYLEL